MQFTVEAWNEGQIVGQAAVAEGQFLEVGRQAAGLAISDLSLSGRHFQLNVADGRLLVDDLGSTNGTWANELPVTQRVQIGPGARIMAGNTTFIVKQAGAQYVEGTRWCIVAVPQGMQAQPQYGFDGEQTADFAETVMCREEAVPVEVPLRDYIARQFAMLGQHAKDLRHAEAVAPPEVVAQENIVSDVAFVYDRFSVRQLHAYVRSGPGIGIAVWTFRPVIANPVERFWSILSSLRFG